MARHVEEVVVDVAVAVHQLSHRARAFERDPLAAAGEALLQPLVMDAPVAGEEIEVVQSREIRSAFRRLRCVLRGVRRRRDGERGGDQCGE